MQSRMLRVLGTRKTTCAVVIQRSVLTRSQRRHSVWIKQEESEFSPHSLRQLFNNQIPAIRIPNFASPDQCAQLLTACDRHWADYEGLVPIIRKIGPSQFQSRNNKKQYFDSVAEATAIRNSIFSFAGLDVLDKVRMMLSKALSREIGLASEPAYGCYFAGVMRHITIVQLHFDYAPSDAPDWSIAAVRKQLTWNLYIATPATGGHTTIYNQPWQPEIFEKYRLPKESSTLGFDHACVADRAHFTISPKVGDLWFFNPQNFHKVADCQDLRVTVSSFVGEYSDGTTVIWS